MDVYARHPGRTHDALVFLHSPLARQLSDAGSHLAQSLARGVHVIAGVEVPRVIVADSAYATRQFVVSSFKSGIARVNAGRARFNTMHSKARVKIEHAWGCLKNKFQCCRLGIRTDVKVAVMVFMCCCILHNICIDHGEVVPEGVDPDAIQDYEDRLAEDGVGLDPLPAGELALGARARPADLVQGERIREALVELSNLPVARGKVLGSLLVASGQVLGSLLVASGQVLGSLLVASGQVEGSLLVASGQELGSWLAGLLNVHELVEKSPCWQRIGAIMKRSADVVYKKWACLKHAANELDVPGRGAGSSRGKREQGGVDSDSDDSAYATRQFVVSSFKSGIARVNAGRARFNTMHSKARVKIEHAWGCLKNKFQCCRLGIRTDVKVAVMVFMCCCILHNICIDHGEVVPEGVDPDAIQDYEDRLAEDGVGLDPLPAGELALGARARPADLVQGERIREALVVLAGQR
ncbi:hypothetical protein QJQ45_029753 [Haematococcus lacustris]|nr:hypothetical protein QJQ45_029753 [Haematococcus lacustris]